MSLVPFHAMRDFHFTLRKAHPKAPKKVSLQKPISKIFNKCFNRVFLNKRKLR